MTKNKIDIKDLSDLDINDLPDGFAIIFDGDKPVGAITKYKYYQYLTQLISKVKEHILKPKEKKNGSKF